MKQYPNTMCFSVSHTTRKPRPGEVHGTHYYYVTPEEFLDLVAKNGFVEHAHVHGNYYGTSIMEIQRLVKLNQLVVLDIDLQGCKLIKQNKSFLDEFNPYFLRVTVDLKHLVWAFRFPFFLVTIRLRRSVSDIEEQKLKSPFKPVSITHNKRWNPYLAFSTLKSLTINSMRQSLPSPQH